MEDTVVMRPPRGRGLRRPLVPLAQAIQKDDMRRFGRHRRAARLVDFRRRMYEERFDESAPRARWTPTPRCCTS